MWLVTCPECDLTGVPEDFDMSCADECFCPKCGAAFTVEQWGEPEDDEDEDE